MNAGSAPVTPVGRTTTSSTVWPSLVIVRSVTSAFGRSTGALDCAPTSTARASVGVICSIGLPPPAARASRNFWIFRSTPSLPARWFVISGLLVDAFRTS